ncbi:MAG: GNAT family N-acetyltransferase [Actinomycetota bacterium]
MDVEIGPIGPERFDDLIRVLSASFGHEPRPWEVVHERTLWEHERTLAAFDDPDIVGVASAQSRELTVPGTMVPLAAVVAVGVLPTHRRRGILTALMRRQLEDIRDRGEAVAALWASEGAIYQRYGYGLGTLTAHFRVDRRHAAFARAAEVRGAVRLVDRTEAEARFAPIYDRVRAERPGMLDRPPAWWRYLLADPEQERRGFSAYFHAVYESPEGPDGYAVYRIKPGWSHRGADHVLELEELMAATPEAYEALWRYCLGIDLVGRIEGWKRPVDEPLPFMLAEPRRLQLGIRDGLWVRLVDVPRALEGRRYSAAGALTVEVRDPFCPWNEGTYRVEGGPDGASCARVEGEPELVAGVADLGAAFLGGVSLGRLVRAGRVQEVAPGAVARADAMLRWDPAPWSPHVF